MRILLDLDDTLANFTGGVARLWGLTTADLLRHWTPGQYGVVGPLSRALQTTDRQFPGSHDVSFDYPPSPESVRTGGVMTEAEFWKPINTTPGFWLGLDKLPWADALFETCLKAAGGARGEDEDGTVLTTYWGDLWVVTAPSRCPGCVREKEDWLAKHYGLPPDRMVPTRRKELLAQPGVALVDDHELHIDNFRKAGGIGVLFPATHNRLHAQAADPLAYVRNHAPFLDRRSV